MVQCSPEGKVSQQWHLAMISAGIMMQPEVNPCIYPPPCCPPRAYLCSPLPWDFFPNIFFFSYGREAVKTLPKRGRWAGWEAQEQHGPLQPYVCPRAPLHWGRQGEEVRDRAGAPGPWKGRSGGAGTARCGRAGAPGCRAAIAPAWCGDIAASRGLRGPGERWAAPPGGSASPSETEKWKNEKEK